jgi:hypothetical protein
VLIEFLRVNCNTGRYNGNFAHYRKLSSLAPQWLSVASLSKQSFCPADASLGLRPFHENDRRHR